MKNILRLKSTWIQVFDRLSDERAGKLIKMLYYRYYKNTAKLTNEVKLLRQTDEELLAYFNVMAIECDELNSTENKEN